MRLPQLLIAMISLALLLTVVIWEWRQRTSPGPLHPSHASISELQGKPGCAACHGNAATEMAGACAICHKDVKAQLDSLNGIHGTLSKAAAPTCGTCHSDHNGLKVQLVTDRSFRLAGVADPAVFDHSKFRKYELTGRHATLKCEQCHPAAKALSLVKDQKRFLGLSQDCISCHKDPHEGTYGPDCLSCHGQTHSFEQADGFAHAKDFPLVGGHADRKCKDCHDKTSLTSVAALKLHPIPARACVVCHDSPHRDAMINSIAQMQHTTKESTCSVCHGRDETTFLNPTAKMTAQDHAATGFALSPPHDKADCSSCHQEIGKRKPLGRGADIAVGFAKLFPGRAQSACGDCHDSPHRGELVTSVARTLQKSEAHACSACHGKDDRSFLSPTAKMTAAQHLATGFDVGIPHEKVECSGCHKEIGKRKPLKRGPELPARFASLYRQIPQNACEQCHTDPHAGQFKATASQGRCVACHAMERFTPSNFDLVAHAKTQMPLTGAHRAVACLDCHKTEGKIERFIPTPTACNDCHADVHIGRFDEPSRQKTVNGQSGCARCHTTSNFSPVQWNAQDHAVWTSYVLTGAHEKASCVACHRPQPTPDEHGRTLGFAPTSCIACHADPHAGQFAIQNFTDCARCHSESGKFTQTTFDHQRDSVFKLDAVHVKLACAACHRPAESSAASKVIRYRPLGTTCRDCHGPGELPEQEQP